MNREQPRRSSDGGQRTRGPSPRRLARSACDGTALALVLLVLIGPVVAAGGALSWVPFFIQTVAVGLAICWCVRSGLERGRAASRPRSLAWIALLGALVALPLLPLPPSWIGLLSPRAYEITRTALPGWPERAPFAELASSRPARRGWLPLSWRPLAVAPDSTRDALLLGLAYAVIAGAVAAYPWNERRRKPLGVAVNALIALGVFESVYSLLQYSQGGGRLLWFECGPATSCTGTYVNRNHFAGFLEMVLPLAVARAAGARARVRADLGPVGGSWLRLADGAFRSAEAGRSAAYASVALLLAVALAASGSRGGLVCATVALLATWRIAPGRRGSVGWRIPAAAIAGLLLLATFPQVVYRWSFDDPTRRSLALETIAMAADFPLAGVGLGGFATVHPLYRSRTHVLGAFPIEHAHDDYLQWAAETGIAGALLAFALLAVLALRVVRRLAAARSGLDADAWALWGSAAAALGLLLHSLVDFNLHTPANAVILAFLVGTLARSTSTTDREPAASRLGLVGRAVLLVASAAWLLAIRQSWLADAAWERSRPPSVLNDLSATEPAPSEDESIAAVERAVALAPRVARFSADLGRRLLDREGSAEQAAGALMRSIELSPMQPWTLIDLASAAAARREPALAADLIARAARLAPYDSALRRRVERWRDDPASIAKRDHDADR